MLLPISIPSLVSSRLFVISSSSILKDSNIFIERSFLIMKYITKVTELKNLECLVLYYYNKFYDYKVFLIVSQY